MARARALSLVQVGCAKFDGASRKFGRVQYFRIAALGPGETYIRDLRGRAPPPGGTGTGAAAPDKSTLVNFLAFDEQSGLGSG